MKFALLFLFSFALQLVAAQFNFQTRELELKSLLDSVRAQHKDSDKKKWNKEFTDLLRKTLNEPTIFNQTFTAIKTLGDIASPDNKLRIINWNVEQEDGTQQYNAFVLYQSEKNDEHKVFELEDKSFMLPGKPEETLESNMWYGALYYNIIPVEKSNKTYYTVLGWDGATRRSNIKLIDVFYVSGNKLKIGFPLFKLVDGSTVRRMFFEHSEKAYMSLKYESDYKRIIFDHLMPENPNMEGIYDYYIPDLSYDAFVFKDGKWILHEDVIGINKKQNLVNMNTIDPKTGKVLSKKVESSWESPSDGSSSGTHVAVMPDMESKNTTELDKQKAAKDKENMTAVELYEQKKNHKGEKEVGSSFNYKKKKSKK